MGEGEVVGCKRKGGKIKFAAPSENPNSENKFLPGLVFITQFLSFLGFNVMNIVCDIWY